MYAARGGRSSPSSSARPTTAPFAPVRRTASTSAASRIPPAARTAPAKPAAHLAEQLEIRPGEGPVAGDRRAEDPRDAGARAARERIRRRQARRVDPAGGADDAVRDVDRDDEPVAERGDELLERPGPECGSADHHAGDARLDERLRVSDRADAAAELHRNRRRRRDGAACELDRRAAVARGAERDDVHERGSGRRDTGDQRERVAAVHCDAVVRASSPGAPPGRRGRRPQGEARSLLPMCYHANTMAATKTREEPSHWPTAEHEDLFATIATLRTRAEVEHFLRDLCTRSELDAMAHRWQVARLLNEGLPYLEVAKRAHASTTTVTRVAQWLRRGEGGYALALRRRSRRS